MSDKDISRKLFNFITSELLHIPLQEDFLQVIGGDVFVGTRKLNKVEKDNVVKSSKDLAQNYAFRLLVSELERIAFDKMANESVDPESFIRNKMILWTIDIMKKKIVNMQTLK